MKIYTRTGDQGKTGLFGGARLDKDDVRVEAYGAVDELNASLGVARAHALPPSIELALASIQDDLLRLGAELACAPGMEHKLTVERIDERDAQRLEGWIDEHEEQLPALTNFVLPAGVAGSAFLHQARTVCRRAERRVVSAGRHSAVTSGVLIYLNRLSDLLFVFARRANQEASQPDVIWKGRGR